MGVSKYLQAFHFYQVQQYQNMDDLDHLYLPSRWSKRYPAELVVPRHTEFINKESTCARTQIKCELNVPYGKLGKEKFDLFGTDLKQDSPIFVFVHGGYWQEENLRRDTYHYIATNLHNNEIKSIFVGYELCPNVSLAEIVAEIETAIRKIIEFAKRNRTKKLYLAGYSSGAHLVAMIFTSFINSLPVDEQNLIKSVILICGIYDLSDIPKTVVNLPLNLNDITALQFSPSKQAISDGSGTLFHVIAAKNDSPVFVKQSCEFHEKLRNDGVNADLLIVDNVDHFDIIELLSDEEFQVTKYILKIIQE